MSSLNDWLVTIIAYFEIFKILLGTKKKYKFNGKLEGKTVLITGGNTGLGKETAYQLSLYGAKVIIACRDVQKGETAAQYIRIKNPKANVMVMKVDLSSLSSVREFSKSVAEQESKIDILINNAGVFGCPESQTIDGYEMHFGTNHLGHYLLTLSLLPLLREAPKARIVNVSAALHIYGKIHFENINLRNGAYTPLMGYAQSKLANIMFTQELARRLGPNSSVTAYSLHPGVIITELQRNLSKFLKYLLSFFTVSIEMGVQTTLYCALEESLQNESGFYYDDCSRVNRMISQASDVESAKKLWQLSSDLVKLEDNLNIN